LQSFIVGPRRTYDAKARISGEEIAESAVDLFRIIRDEDGRHSVILHGLSFDMIPEGARRRPMVIGDRLRELREQKGLSQGDIEERTGLLRCYTSRVENNHTVPSVETLGKMARALEVPMYKLFYEGEGKAEAPKLKVKRDAEWGASGRDAKTLRKFQRYLEKLSDKDRKVLMAMATKLART
jgi:transcriptional regulator with XRE-family HTH domain